MTQPIISDELTLACLDFIEALASDPDVSPELQEDARREFERLKHLRPKR